MSKKSQPRTQGGAKPSDSQRRASAERAEAARVRIQQAQRRRQLYLVGGAILAVVVVVAVLVVVKVVSGGNSGQTKTTQAANSVQRAVTSVPAATLNKVGVGSGVTPPTKIKAPALTANGKPKVLYVGAEYCPFCAAERWSVVVALSRFGTFSNLKQTASSPTDQFPDTKTLSFHGASYTSKYLSFTGKELQDTSGAKLETLSSTGQALVSKYDAPPYVSGQAGSIPFIDIGGKYIVSGSSYSPGVLSGKSHLEIAKALSDPSSPVAKSADGAANALTATVCTITNQRPASVCSSPGVTAAAATLASTK